MKDEIFYSDLSIKENFPTTFQISKGLDEKNQRIDEAKILSFNPFKSEISSQTPLSTFPDEKESKITYKLEQKSNLSSQFNLKVTMENLETDRVYNLYLTFLSDRNWEIR